jgi:hypothetical protein
MTSGRAVQYEGKDADKTGEDCLFVQIIWLICEGEHFDSTFFFPISTPNVNGFKKKKSYRVTLDENPLALISDHSHVSRWKYLVMSFLEVQFVCK